MYLRSVDTTNHLLLTVTRDRAVVQNWIGALDLDHELLASYCISRVKSVVGRCTWAIKGTLNDIVGIVGEVECDSVANVCPCIAWKDCSIVSLSEEENVRIAANLQTNPWILTSWFSALTARARALRLRRVELICMLSKVIVGMAW